MTIDEQLKIINEWGNVFEIMPAAGDGYVGMLVTNDSGTRYLQIQGNSKNDVIRKSYLQFSNYVWNVVCSI